MHPPHTLDPTPDPPFFISQLPIQLLIKDNLFKEKNESEENRMYKAYIARWAKDEKDGPKTLNQRLESQNYTIYDKCLI